MPEFTDIDYRVYNATLDFDLGFATLTSATSYNELEEPFRSDLTTQFSPLLIASASRAERAVPGPDHQVRQGYAGAAPRIAVERQRSSGWLGGYYTKEKGDIIQHIEAVTPGTLTPIPPGPLGDATLHSEYEEIAGFFSGTIHFGDSFDLTLGGRYSENDQEATQVAGGALAGGPRDVPGGDLLGGRVHVFRCAEVEVRRAHGALRARRERIPPGRTERAAAAARRPTCRGSMTRMS